LIATLFEIIKSTLADGKDLLISGFGTFLIRQKNARWGRNPQTEKALMLKPREVVVVKTSGVLRERMNRSWEIMLALANF
jgi:integration host factor subunit alpha